MEKKKKQNSCKCDSWEPVNESEASGLVNGSVPDLGLLRPATRLLPHGQAGRPVGVTQFSGLQFHHKKEHSPLTGGWHEFSPVHMVPLSPILCLLGCPFPATFVDPSPLVFPSNLGICKDSVLCLLSFFLHPGHGRPAAHNSR